MKTVVFVSALLLCSGFVVAPPPPSECPDSVKQAARDLLVSKGFTLSTDISNCLLCSDRKCDIPPNMDLKTCFDECKAAVLRYRARGPNYNMDDMVCDQCTQQTYGPDGSASRCLNCKTWALDNNVNNIYNAMSECQDSRGDPTLAKCVCEWFHVLDSPRTNYQEFCANCYDHDLESADLVKRAAARKRVNACQCCHANYQVWLAKNLNGFKLTDPNAVNNYTSKCKQWAQQAQDCLNITDPSCKTQEGYTMISTNLFVDPEALSGPTCLSTLL